MQIQVNTASGIEGSDDLNQWVEAEVSGGLERYGDQLTRVEVHLSDVNADKTVGNDKRCLLECRLAGRKPIAVSHEASAIEEAIDGAMDKMKRTLDSTLGRLYETKGRTSYGGDQNI